MIRSVLEDKNPGVRLDVIDQYRGFAVVLMVLADYLSQVGRVPAWLKHAPGVGLTVVDLIPRLARRRAACL